MSNFNQKKSFFQNKDKTSLLHRNFVANRSKVYILGFTFYLVITTGEALRYLPVWNSSSQEPLG